MESLSLKFRNEFFQHLHGRTKTVVREIVSPAGLTISTTLFVLISIITLRVTTDILLLVVQAINHVRIGISSILVLTCVGVVMWVVLVLVNREEAAKTVKVVTVEKSE